MRYKIPRHFGRYCRIIGVVLFVVCTVRVLFEYHSDGTSDRKEMYISNHSNSPYQKSDVPYLVDTETCKIPNINPFDPSVLLYLRQGRKISCNKHLPITYEDGSRLCINWTAVDQSPWRETFGFCRYQAIYRPLNITDHDFYKYLEPSKEFNVSIEMKDDFVRVFCYTNGGGKIYTNYHQFILLKDDVEARCSKSFQKHKNNKDLRETLNVIMIGVDSISRLNFMRYMQKTRSYLLNDLEAVELTGYNKVADNTFVNIVPMTLGKFLEEVPWNEKMNKTPFDNYNFIWKQFGSRGYRTLYAEDAPSIAIFDYLKAGFHKPPTDYFNRHFSVAMTADRKSWYNSHHCLVNKMETEIMLDYVINLYLYTNTVHTWLSPSLPD
ncbi:hypothetical protein FSP39_005304 [Pinctada imbricata]|uniref:Uncharacterized protein n=1 Tax=Pinctada imbricata TaxID=66713 RepID=A0AA89BY26_PINIB|nr:hypothetical protein FSP39_005304 [Pinctada imbricata]